MSRFSFSGVCFMGYLMPPFVVFVASNTLLKRVQLFLWIAVVLLLDIFFCKVDIRKKKVDCG